jgi:endonuclease/exonuclease/phosphatase family metal-dependent hydrolase
MFKKIHKIKTYSFILLILLCVFSVYAEKVTIMTFNIENGGTQIDFNQVVQAIKTSKADVVGIQEAWGNLPRLANALGWKYYNLQQHIISRYPLFKSPKFKDKISFIEITPGKFIALCNVHLPDEGYGPDLIMLGTPIKIILQNEQLMRLPTAKEFATKLIPFIKQDVPVFITGDFNSLSHLDNSIPWPVTRFLEKIGFIDSYRLMHPNINKEPGFSWPAKRPKAKHSFDNYNPTKEDKPARLDFIFTGGNSRVLGSELQCDGFPWPSDHCAVFSKFEVTPSPFKKKSLVRISANPKKKPKLILSKNVIHSGENFTIKWMDMPGNRYDYIRITPINSSKIGWGEAVRLYTNGKHSGNLHYNLQNAKGNWLSWHKGLEGVWPMKPGIYEVKLMLDDSFTELASTKITIIQTKS